MDNRTSSALVTEQGSRILLRLHGRFYQLNQLELRQLLKLPAGPPGLGITIDANRWRFEFPGDSQTVEITSTTLHRRLGKMGMRPAVIRQGN